MQIDSLSEEMRWVLLKFLKDSLDFLSDDAQKALKTKRKDWALEWQIDNLSDLQIKKWMPREDVV